MSICTGLKQQAGDGMGEKKERGRFTLRFNEGDPISTTNESGSNTAYTICLVDVKSTLHA